MFDTAGSVDNVTVNATGGPAGNVNPTDIDEVEVELYNGSSVIANESLSYDSHNTTVELTNTSGVDRIVVTAAVSSTATDGDVIDADLYVRTNPTGFIQTANTQPVVVNDAGFISGRVSDTENNDLPDVTVRVFNTTTGFSKTTTTNDNGDYTIEVPPGQFEVVAERPGFSSAQPRARTVEANRTTTANFVLERLIVADEIEVEPKSDSAQVGANNSFTVTVFDQNGDRLEDAEVTGTVVDDTSPITFASENPLVTDQNGEATFVVTSTETATNDEIEFEVTSATNNGDTVSTTATKSFVLNGEGEIDGTVLNTRTTDPVENASVYAVLNDTFRSNTVETSLNLNNNTNTTTSTDVVGVTVTVGAGQDTNSFDTFVFDAQNAAGGSGGDLSNVGTSDIQTFTVGGTDVSGQVTSISEGNNGQSITIDLDGSTTLSEGEDIVLELSDTQNIADGDPIDTTINGAQNDSPSATVSTNTQTTTGGLAVDDADGVVFFRLVDNSTGQILDVNDDYRVQTPNGSDTAIRALSAVNTTNETVGEGFAVIDLDNDGNVTFGHTRLEPREYYAQVSLTAPRNSDVDEVGDADNAPENFTNVTVSGETAVFSPDTDLTLDAIENRSEVTGANQVDAPGFVNSFGVDTDGTDENGFFKLDKLFTNFQEGRTYTVIADKVGFDREYGEVYVTEDGAKFTNSPFEGLNLEPEDVEAEQVNIVQVGSHPPLAETDGVELEEITLFGAEESGATTAELFEAAPTDAQADSPFQRVSRDNTIDVIRVETTTDDGTPINGTAVVNIEEYDFTDAADDENIEGDFVDVLGGTNVSDGAPGSDTITVNTGDDGVAVLLYETDRGGQTIFANKTATLTNDRSATDGSNVTFVGVTAFQSASISGIVTDRDNNRVPFSVAYVKEFNLGERQNANTRFTFTPLTDAPEDSPAFGDYVDINENPDNLWAVELQEFNSTSGEFETVRQVNVTTTTLDSYNFDQLENDFPSVEVLPSVRAEAGADGFDFYDTTTEDADYTLDPLPAVAEAGDRGQTVETDYTVEGVRLNENGTDDDDIAGVDANDGLAELFVNTTDDANLVLPFQLEDADYELSSLDAPANATAGDNITVSTTVRNDGGRLNSAQTLSFRIDLNENGALEADEEVASVPIDLAPGTSDTVSLTVSTDDVPAGTFEHGFVVPGDAEVRGDITIESSNNGNSGNSTDTVDEFDTNNDGDISPGEAQEAIVALNNGDISPSEAQEIIVALNS